jgi:hypothetical protein
VSVETYGGQGGIGATYASAVSVSVHVKAKRQLVRASDGTEAISELTLTVHPDDEAYFTPESRVTYGTRVSRVLSALPDGTRGYTTLVKVACS